MSGLDARGMFEFLDLHLMRLGAPNIGAAGCNEEDGTVTKTWCPFGDFQSGRTVRFLGTEDTVSLDIVDRWDGEATAVLYFVASWYEGDVNPDISLTVDGVESYIEGDTSSESVEELIADFVQGLPAYLSDD